MNNFQLSGERSTTAYVLIGLGVLLLLGQFFGGGLMSLLWPLFVVVPGAIFLYVAYNSAGKAAGMALPGAIITGTGFILFYQNLTGHWESWAYAWMLYPVFVGAALTFMGRRSDNEAEYRRGHGLMRWGLISFVIAGVFFELLIFGGFGGLLSGWIAPVLLVGVGVYMLSRGRSHRGRTVPFSDKAKRKNEQVAVNGDF